ncbi:hypothetical protein AIB04_004570 [Salmonella enterica subsp. enterica serovar Thompson]|nr:hypothetical protein [Salmonella enterica subsp. enterica serovar Thompson]
MSVDFCDARQGGGAYGKTPAARPFVLALPCCSHVLGLRLGNVQYCTVALLR